MAVISFEVLTGVSWAFAGLAFILTGGRFWIRCTIIKKLSWDDAVHLLALLLLLAQIAIVSGATTVIYHPANLTQKDLSFFSRLDIAGVFVSWCCFYAVKISFMLLYRRLFQISERFMKAWWIVMAIVVLTFWPLIVGLLTECGSPSALGHIDHCQSPSALRRQNIFVAYSCVLNVFSDLAIIALPLAMLKTLQMRTTAKLGLAGVFCCAIITIAFDILRAVETLTKGGDVGSTTLWTNLESAIAVIVSCLPSFAALLNKRDRKNAGRKAGPYQLRSLIVSDSVKDCISAGSSINSGDDGRSSEASKSEKASPNASCSTNVHITDVSSAV